MGAVCGKEKTPDNRQQVSKGAGKSKELNVISHNLVVDNPNKLTDFYKVDDEVIGEGSFGSVSKATELKSGLVRAVKVISKSDVQSQPKLMQEMELMKQCDHPNIIKLYETFQDKDKMFLLMELAAGGELFDTIVEHGTFGERDAAYIVKQILSAILYLHRNKIVHRDLKPENFLFSEKGKPIQESALKIIDFGLSCRLPTPVEVTDADFTSAGVAFNVHEFGNGATKVQFKSNADSKFAFYNGWTVHKIDGNSPKTFMHHVSFSKVDTLVKEKVKASGKITFTLKSPIGTLTTKAGTPYYVAPEVLGGNHDEKSDIWSIGVITYILLCGFPPFAGSNDQSILMKVMRGKYRYPQEDWKHISKDATNLIDKMLTFDYRKRASAAECMEDIWIKQLAPNTTDVAVPSSFVDRLKGFRQQNALQKVALFAIASNINEASVSEMKATFQKFDVDGDGSLTFDEIKQGLAEANIVMTDEIKQILESIDSDGSKRIDYTEFIAATLNSEQSQEEALCWTAFRIFDTDGNGSITTDELKEVFKHRFDENELDEEAIQDIMKTTDTNGDGVIDFNEFLTMMRNADSKADAFAA